MGSIPKRLILGVLGVALTLGFWTVKGWFVGTADATVAHIPDKIWDGGGGTVVLEAETTDAGRVSVTFETNSPIDSPDHRMLETWEKIGPGLHTYTIEVPQGVAATAEVEADAPKVGSKVRVAIKVGDKVAAEDGEILSEPLKAGYAFTAQVHLEDIATGKVEGS